MPLDNINLHLPEYLGGQYVELETDGLADDEEIVGWVDEYGTITSSKANQQIGDIVSCTNSDYSALIIKRGVI